MALASPLAQPLFPAGVAGNVLLADFDAIQAVSPAWDQTHAQIGRGRARVRVVLANTARMQLAQISRAPGVQVRGTPPRGTSLVAVLLEGTGLHGQGVPWGRDHVGIVPCGTEFEVMSTSPHSMFCLAIDASRLNEVATERWGAPFPSTMSGPCIRLRDEESRRRLTSTWARWLALGRHRPEGLVDGNVAARMEDEILRALFDAADPVLDLPPARPRLELARRAERFIRDSLTEDVSIARVCDAIRSNPRSVHVSFQGEYGIAPMAYRKALRLDACRRDLRSARPEATVSAIAAKWGFFRFGYFSADYRRMFGENPSDTLSRRTEGRAAEGGKGSGGT